MFFSIVKYLFFYNECFNVFMLGKHYRLCYTVELVQSDTQVFRNPVTSDKIYGPKVFLLTKIKPEYSNVLSLVPCYVGLERFHDILLQTYFIVQKDKRIRHKLNNLDSHIPLYRCYILHGYIIK